MKGIYFTATALQLLRWTSLGLCFYSDIEKHYAAIGVNISITEVEVVPLEIEGNYVRYLVTATRYTYIGYSDRQLVHSDQ